MDKTLAPDVGVDFEALSELIAAARKVALAYRALTGRPLGVTGEVGECEAARLLGLRLAPVRENGFDAVDNAGKKYQVKARCLPDGGSKGQRFGSINVDAEWDYVLAVSLRANLTTRTIFQADREAVLKELNRRKANRDENSRRIRSDLPESVFRRIGCQVWPKVM